MIAAAFVGDVELLKQLYDEGVDVNEETPEGYNALTCAVAQDDLNTVKYLVHLGGKLPESTLLPAIRKEALYIETLMQMTTGAATVSPVTFDTDEETVASPEVKNKSKMKIDGIRAARSIIDIDEDDTFHDDTKKKPEDPAVEVRDIVVAPIFPVHEAATSGNVEMLNLLLNLGADPNRVDVSGKPPIWEAVRQGHEAVILRLLPLCENFDYVEKGFNFLHHTCRCRRALSIDCIKEILKRTKIDINIRSTDGHTPLMCAVDGPTDRNILVKWLVKNGASVNAKDKTGKTALHYCWNAQDVKTLIEAGTKVNMKDKHGNTALINCCGFAKKTAVVKELIDQGAVLNAKNHKGWAAFIRAAYVGANNSLRVLAKHGADVHIISSHGSNAMSYAVAMEQVECIQVLHELGTKILPGCLMEACGANNVDILRKLVEIDGHKGVGGALLYTCAQKGFASHIMKLRELGIDIEYECATSGKRPLGIAALNGHLDVVEKLLDAGAKYDEWGADGVTPLILALSGKHFDVAQLLIDQGACMYQMSPTGMSVLDYATNDLDIASSLRILEFLAANKFNFADVVDQYAKLAAATPKQLDKCTDPVSLAIDMHLMSIMFFQLTRPGSVPIVEALLNLGFKIEMPLNSERWTPLLTASAKQGNIEMVKMLVSKGAEVDITDVGLRNTPLHHSAEVCDIELINYFISLGIDVNVKNRLGLTPIGEAVYRGRIQSVQHLLMIGADKDGFESESTSPIVVATIKKENEITKYLASKGAQVHFKFISDVALAKELSKTKTLNRVFDTFLSLGLKIEHRNVADLFKFEINNEEILTKQFQTVLQKVPELINKDGFGWSMMHFAAYTGNHTLIKILATQYKLDVNETVECTGDTPMHLAAQEGYVQAIYALHKLGANLTSINDKGNAAIHEAVIQGKQIAVDILIKFDRLNATIENKSGRNPFELACVSRQFCIAQKMSKNTSAMCKILESEGITHLQSWYNSNGHNALHECIVDASSKSVEFLLNEGWYPDATTIYGRTGLMLAMMTDPHHCVSIAKMLIKAGADVCASCDTTKDSPLHIAARRGSKPLINILMESGADPLQLNAKGLTPHCAALEMGNDDAMQFIYQFCIQRARSAAVYRRQIS